MTEIPNLVNKIKDVHRRNIKVTPTHTNRASSIGSPCIRQLVYNRVAWRHKQPFDIKSQLRLDEGNNQETIVIRDLIGAGVEVIETQVSDMDEKTETTMHLDGIVVDDGKRYVLEIKSCAPYIFQAISRYAIDDYYRAMDELGVIYPWFRKYPPQLNLYMYSRTLEMAICVFKDKSSGDLKQFNVPLNLDFLDSIFKKANRVNALVAAFKDSKADPTKPESNKFLPPKIDDSTECRMCQFNTICLPDIDFGKPIQIKDDPGFEKKLDRWHVLGAAAKEYDNINDELKLQCEGVENTIVGKYHIDGKRNKKGSWLKKIKFIDDDDKIILIEENKMLYSLIKKDA